MLDIRTNILFDKETYQLLVSRAKIEKKSIGELVRKAVKKTYRESAKDIIRQRTEAFNEIMALRKKIKPLPKNVKIKDLINWGRKYKYP